MPGRLKQGRKIKVHHYKQHWQTSCKSQINTTISQLTNLCTGIRSWPPPISRHPFRCSFRCVLLWNQIYLVHNVPFDNTTLIYLI